MSRSRTLAVSVLFALAAACSKSAADATPESAVRAWIEHMSDSVTTQGEAREAYELLSQATKQNLQDRASRDAPRLGRRLAPHEMLADGRFGLRFRPKTFKTTPSGAGRATVEIMGEPGEQAAVAVLREAKGWRIELDLPEVIPLAKRPDGGL
jgi:hypothetical protein